MQSYACKLCNNYVILWVTAQSLVEWEPLRQYMQLSED